MRKGLITGLSLLALALPASAQEAGPQALQITATNVTAGADERADDSGAVRPGDVVEYQLLFTNITEGDVDNVVFSDPVPGGLVYVLGTATVDRQDVLVEYSIDSGLSWSDAPTVVSQDEQGQAVRTPAPAAAYTNIRWTVGGTVSPGAQVTARFRAEMPSAGEAGS